MDTATECGHFMCKVNPVRWLDSLELSTHQAFLMAWLRGGKDFCEGLRSLGRRGRGS